MRVKTVGVFGVAVLGGVGVVWGLAARGAGDAEATAAPLSEALTVLQAPTASSGMYLHSDWQVRPGLSLSGPASHESSYEAWGEWPLRPREGEIHLAAMSKGQSVYYPADWSADGVLDATDINLYLEAFRDGLPEADLNGDGRIDADDLQSFMRAFMAAEWRYVLGC